MARINLDEAIRIAMSAYDRCEATCEVVSRAVVAGELDRDEADRIFDAACDLKQDGYKAALEFAPLDFLKGLLGQRYDQQ